MLVNPQVSGLALRFLLKLQPNLRTLSFASCPKVQGTDFYALDSRTGPSCRLTELDMRGCASLDDASVVAIVTHNQSTLQKLSACALTGITAAAFRAIAACTQLRVLDLSMCRSLTDSDVAALASGCLQLYTLLLQGCVNITDAGLAAIAQRLTQLEHLSLEFCYNVTDAGFSQIVSQCQRLTRLNVKACNQLTTAAFRNLVRDKETAHPLKVLDLGACAGQLTTIAYAAIVKQKFPRCVVHTA